MTCFSSNKIDEWKVRYEDGENSSDLFKEIATFIESITSLNERMIFFSGSFYPWHRGHKECVLQTLRYQEWPICILPDRNPWKEEYLIKKNLFEEFLHICEDLKNFNILINPFLWAAPHSCATVHWMTKIPIRSKGFILGSDTFIELKQWTNYSILLSDISKIFIIPRIISKEKIQNFIKELRDEGFTCEFHYLQSHPYERLASRNLRT